MDSFPSFDSHPSASGLKDGSCESAKVGHLLVFMAEIPGTDLT